MDPEEDPKCPTSERVRIGISSPAEPSVLPLDHSGGSQVRLFFPFPSLLLTAAPPCTDTGGVRNHGGPAGKGGREARGGKTEKLTASLNPQQPFHPQQT